MPQLTILYILLGNILLGNIVFLMSLDLGPVYTIPDCIGAERFSYRIRLLFTLRHSNPVCDAGQKSLRFGGDMKSNPVCAGAV